MGAQVLTKKEVWTKYYLTSDLNSSAAIKKCVSRVEEVFLIRPDYLESD